MDKHLLLDLVTREGSLFSGQARHVILTTLWGDVGIYPGHAPLLAELGPGPLRVYDMQGEEQIYFVPAGFLEVQPGRTIVLADTALRAQDLDKVAAEKAKRDAEAEFAAHHDRESADHVARAAAMLRTLHELSLSRKGNIKR